MFVYKKLNCKKNDCILDYEKNIFKMYLFWNYNVNKIYICRKKICYILIRFSLDKFISLLILMMSRVYFFCYILWREFLCLFY